MSLTQFVRLPEVCDKFETSFSMPDFNLAGEMKAVPVTKHYALVGTAFDYLMRFMLKRANGAKVVEREFVLDGDVLSHWVAFSSLDHLHVYGSEKQLRDVMEVVAHCDLTMRDKFHGRPSSLSDWIRASYLLAKVDAIYRAGLKGAELRRCVDDIWRSYSGMWKYFNNMDRAFRYNGDFRDLMRLSEVLSEECFKKGIFVAKDICVLNPLFGRMGWGSHLVGGADCDLIVDDTLIDIKTTKYLSFTREQFNQLMGYYLLHRISGVDGFDGNIDYLGIYYARHGLFFRFSVDSVLKDDVYVMDVAEWFVDTARKRYNSGEKKFQELLDAWKKTL